MQKEPYTDDKVEESILELKKTLIEKRDKAKNKEEKKYYRDLSRKLDSIKLDKKLN